MSMFFTKDQISKMKFDRTPNKILVKPTRGSNEVVLAGGIKIYMDNRFGQEKHAPTTGTIIAHCGSLVHSRMPWFTTNELQTGDYIIYSFESAMYALDNMHGRVIVDEDKEAYFLIDYEDIFVIKRDKQIIPINGYLMVSPIEETDNSTFERIKENTNSSRYGKVEYVGARNSCYIAAGKKRDDVFDFEEPICPGDIIIFNRDSDIPVEYPLHRSLGGSSQTFFRLQKRDIDAIIPISEKEKYGFK